MSYEDSIAIIDRIEENDYDATDVTFDEFITVMKHVTDYRDFDAILEAHPEYLNKQDKDGKTALILTAERGMGDAVRTLIESHGADIFIKDKTGRTAAQHFKKYFEDNPQEMEEIGEDGLKFFMDIFEKKARSVGKKTTGLDVVSRQKQMGDLGKLPPDVLNRVGELSTGLPGTLAQQRKTIRESVGKGRKRKSKKTRKLVKRKSRGGAQTRDQARTASAVTEAERVRSEAARAEAARIIANPPARLGLGPQNAAPPATVTRGGKRRA